MSGTTSPSVLVSAIYDLRRQKVRPRSDDTRRPVGVSHVMFLSFQHVCELFEELVRASGKGEDAINAVVLSWFERRNGKFGVKDHERWHCCLASFPEDVQTVCLECKNAVCAQSSKLRKALVSVVCENCSACRTCRVSTLPVPFNRFCRQQSLRQSCRIR